MKSRRYSTIALLVVLAFGHEAFADPPLGPTLTTKDTTTTDSNTHILKFTSGCTVTANGSEADVACSGGGTPASTSSHVVFVSGTSGNDTTGNGSPSAPYATIGKATTAGGDHSLVFVAPGTYIEEITIPHTYTQWAIMGSGASTLVYSPDLIAPVFSWTAQAGDTGEAFFAFMNLNMATNNTVGGGTAINMDGSASATALNTVAVQGVYGDSILNAQASVTVKVARNVYLFSDELGAVTLDRVADLTALAVSIVGFSNAYDSTLTVLPSALLAQQHADMYDVRVQGDTTLTGAVAWDAEYMEQHNIVATGLANSINGVTSPTVICTHCYIDTSATFTYPNNLATGSIELTQSFVGSNLTVTTSGTTRTTAKLYDVSVGGTRTCGDYIDCVVNPTPTDSITVSSNTGTIRGPIYGYYSGASTNFNFTDIAVEANNPTPAANGAQQFGGIVDSRGAGWGTTGPTSYPIHFAFQAEAVQSGGTPFVQGVFGQLVGDTGDFGREWMMTSSNAWQGAFPTIFPVSTTGTAQDGYIVAEPTKQIYIACCATQTVNAVTSYFTVMNNQSQLYANGTTYTFAASGISNGSRTIGNADWSIHAYSAAKTGGTGLHTTGYATNASTLTANGSTMVIDVATGSGAGNLVFELCSDGATCGAGNIYLTCTLACTATAGTLNTCTVNKSAVAAATALSWTETTACTNDPGVNLNAHATIP